MPAVIIDGGAIARKIRARAAQSALALAARGERPCLAVILVGNDPASLSYVGAKEKALAQAGMLSVDARLPEGSSEASVLAAIERFNGDDKVHGILVQLPLPAGLSEGRVIAAISPEKDVDGFCPVSVGNATFGRPSFLPCTPSGVMEILREIGAVVSGAHAVVVGRSCIVGRPMAMMLGARGADATVTMCHSGTRDLARHTLQADILVAAAGRPGLITADMIKPGAVVIDVGVNRVADPSRESGYRLVGDVDFEGALERASHITPVPGGVGPMTIAMLLENVAKAARERAEKKEGKQ
ncbi:MAG: bifunctional 5,10-methylenetetrahydrofolate dehydrogenase/5,10-methenyltetrahydrofolate cyclohydrolase [Treponema sp.]|nr:bifunctional 5,10-methylenetetrahydrofolate dehydrogenase/5,10-methenyltetrahydrofolate cyclohydrolase [Treponema sp.]